MDTFFAILKKTLVGTMFLLLAFTTSYVPHTFNHVEKAEAVYANSGNQQLSLVEQVWTTISTGLSEASNAVVAAMTTSLELKEFSLDAIAWAIAKQMIADMTADLVSWINNGFEGKPGFIGDPTRFLRGVADKELGKIVEELGGSFLCSPFKLDAKLAVELSYMRSKEIVPSCTLSDVINNIDGFLSGTEDSFDKFGWNGWFEITSKPEANTPYGAVLGAKMAAGIKLRNKEGEELNILSWGNGFLSSKSCEPINGTKKEYCTIVTPGKVIVGALSDNLDSDRETLITADEIDEVAAALFNALSTKAITSAQGLLGASGGTGYTPPGPTLVDELLERTRSEIETETTQETLNELVKIYQDYFQLTTEYRFRLTFFRDLPENVKIVVQTIQPAIDDLEEISGNILKYVKPLTNAAGEIILVVDPNKTLPTDVEAFLNKQTPPAKVGDDIIFEYIVATSSEDIALQKELSTYLITKGFVEGADGGLLLVWAKEFEDKTNELQLLLDKPTLTEAETQTKNELEERIREIIDTVAKISPKYTDNEVVKSRNEWDLILAVKRSNAFSPEEMEVEKLIHLNQMTANVCADAYLTVLLAEQAKLEAYTPGGPDDPEPSSELFTTLQAAIDSARSVLDITNTTISVLQTTIDEAIGLDTRNTYDKFKEQNAINTFTELRESGALYAVGNDILVRDLQTDWTKLNDVTLAWRTALGYVEAMLGGNVFGAPISPLPCAVAPGDLPVYEEFYYPFLDDPAALTQSTKNSLDSVNDALKDLENLNSAPAPNPGAGGGGGGGGGSAPTPPPPPPPPPPGGV